MENFSFCAVYSKELCELFQNNNFVEQNLFLLKILFCQIKVIAPTSTKYNTRKQIGFGNGGNLPVSYHTQFLLTNNQLQVFCSISVLKKNQKQSPEVFYKKAVLKSCSQYALVPSFQCMTVAWASWKLFFFIQLSDTLKTFAHVPIGLHNIY